MRFVCLTSVALLLLFTAKPCAAQVVPFLSIGQANEYSPITAEFGGHALTSYMGKSVNVGFAVPSQTPNPDGSIDWTGTATIIGDQGSTLELAGGGKIFLEPLASGLFTATWEGQFSVQDIDGDGKAGTGFFRNAKAAGQPLTVIAVNEPFDFLNIQEGDIWYYDFVIYGKVDLGFWRR